MLNVECQTFSIQHSTFNILRIFPSGSITQTSRGRGLIARRSHPVSPVSPVRWLAPCRSPR
jgi:hypothetical protein